MPSPLLLFVFIAVQYTLEHNILLGFLETTHTAAAVGVHRSRINPTTRKDIILGRVITCTTAAVYVYSMKDELLLHVSCGRQVPPRVGWWRFLQKLEVAAPAVLCVKNTGIVVEGACCLSESNPSWV